MHLLVEPIGGGIGIQDLQISFVCFPHCFADFAQPCGVTLVCTFAAVGASYNGGKGHGRNIAHFLVTEANGNFIARGFHFFNPPIDWKSPLIYNIGAFVLVLWFDLGRGCPG